MYGGGATREEIRNPSLLFGARGVIRSKPDRNGEGTLYKKHQIRHIAFSSHALVTILYVLKVATAA